MVEHSATVAIAIRPCYARISSDSLLLAMEDNDELCLWDIPPRRSTTCWLVCCSVACLAFWLAWPRKVKLAEFLAYFPIARPGEAGSSCTNGGRQRERVGQLLSGETT